MYQPCTDWIRHSVIAAALWLASGSIVANAAQAPQLAADTELATAGYYQLNWDLPSSAPDGAVFLLQEAGDAAFGQARVTYNGADTATTLSGKPDGVYYYRVATAGEGVPEWSETVRVTVQHHPLGRAFAFFAVGAIVFVATVALILFGTLRHRTSKE